MDVSLDTIVDNFDSIINYKQPIFWAAIAHVIFNPLFWNVAGRLENKKQVISKLCGNDKEKGCYLLAVAVFTLGLTRDYLVVYALSMQPKMTDFLSYLNINTPVDFLQTVGTLVLIYGSVLVLTSMYRLGIHGTYLGDYFGIFMESRVTAFPYNLYDNPMYVGSTFCFLGHALRSLTASGILIAIIVWTVYQIAIFFEG
jgi:methylene-fatty-acyl-phospholipid synthase